ncbi:Zinc finger protein, partial [Pseudolycoriella hygida]
ACRVKLEEEHQGIHLFQSGSNVVEIFKRCTSLEINKTDNLPSYICEICHDTIMKFHEFRVNCENSDFFFRQKLKTLILADAKNEDAGQKSSDEKNTKSVENKDNSVSMMEELVCDICGKIFHDKRVLKSHLRIHCGMTESHQHKNLEETSNKKMKDLSSIRDSQNVDRYKCVYCGKKYKKKESFDGHVREHQGLDPFECKLCGTTFKKLRSLVLHNDAKHNENFQKIPCDYDGCDKMFTTKFGLREHISNIHLGIKKARTHSHVSYVCELCGKSFKNKTSLKKHSYSHSGERPFGCTYCSKRFTVKDKLKNHIMRHENIKNFECSYCGTRKVTMAELKIHMNSHTKHKVYPCPQCSAVFSRDSNAKRHFRIVHRGYKPYKCNTCEQSFSKKETLKHHEMIHSGEKPHICNICEKRFIQQIALKKHLKVHDKHTAATLTAASTQLNTSTSAMPILNL